MPLQAGLTFRGILTEFVWCGHAWVDGADCQCGDATAGSEDKANY